MQDPKHAAGPKRLTSQDFVEQLITLYRKANDKDGNGTVAVSFKRWKEVPLFTILIGIAKKHKKELVGTDTGIFWGMMSSVCLVRAAYKNDKISTELTAKEFASFCERLGDVMLLQMSPSLSS